jgi:hypothetical protein
MNDLFGSGHTRMMQQSGAKPYPARPRCRGANATQGPQLLQLKSGPSKGAAVMAHALTAALADSVGKELDSYYGERTSSP